MDTIAAAAAFVLVSLVVGAMVLGSVVAVVTVRGVRRLLWRNRLVPSTRTRAPLWWLWSPRAFARLHRRLCAATATVAHLLPRAKHEPGPLSELANDVLALADTTDAALVSASRLPSPARRPALTGLATDVRTVERLSARLLAAAGAWGSDPAIERARRATVLAERLDALDAARVELADLDLTTSPKALERGATDSLMRPGRARLIAGRVRRLVG
jgi:hypothetical protein